jgi:hypothetical protein
MSSIAKVLGTEFRTLAAHLPNELKKQFGYNCIELKLGGKQDENTFQLKIMDGKLTDTHVLFNLRLQWKQLGDEVQPWTTKFESMAKDHKTAKPGQAFWGQMSRVVSIPLDHELLSPALIELAKFHGELNAEGITFGEKFAKDGPYAEKLCYWVDGFIRFTLRRTSNEAVSMNDVDLSQARFKGKGISQAVALASLERVEMEKVTW